MVIIGFIGFGIMGVYMVCNLFRGDYMLIVSGKYFVLEDLCLCVMVVVNLVVVV